MNQQSGSDSSLVLSYLGLRKSIGIIGIGLPFVLVFGKILLGGTGIESSISAYYYTPMRDVFVGCLCAIGIFLMSYRYDLIDNILSDLAFIFAIGVALLPTTPDLNPTSQDKLIGVLHYVSAALLFLTFAYFSLILFRRTDPSKNPTRRKKQRNIVYTICGFSILACLALILIVSLLPDDSIVNKIDPVFWLESSAVVAFGVSWLIKGETILKDHDS